MSHQSGGSPAIGRVDFAEGSDAVGVERCKQRAHLPHEVECAVLLEREVERGAGKPRQEQGAGRLSSGDPDIDHLGHRQIGSQGTQSGHLAEELDPGVRDFEDEALTVGQRDEPYGRAIRLRRGHHLGDVETEVSDGCHDGICLGFSIGHLGSLTSSMADRYDHTVL